MDPLLNKTKYNMPSFMEGVRNARAQENAKKPEKTAEPFEENAVNEALLEREKWEGVAVDKQEEEKRRQEEIQKLKEDLLKEAA